MRRWWSEAVAAADLVAGRGDLWLPGALAWTLTLGWLPLVVAVTRPPTVADLTFLGASAYTSGAWPWNAVAAGFGVLLIGLSIVVLVAVAETALVAAGRGGMTARAVSRVAALGFVTAAPAIGLGLAGATAFVLVASREFNAPGVGDPVLRSVTRVTPILVAVAVAWTAGSVARAAAVRAAVLGGASFLEALARVPAVLRSGGRAVMATAFGALLVNVAYVALAIVLLSVLWSPLETRLALDGIDAAAVPLLVGFVAIWLCTVLGGGAVHAWASLTWTGVLEDRRALRAGAGRRPQGDPYRP